MVLFGSVWFEFIWLDQIRFDSDSIRFGFKSIKLAIVFVLFNAIRFDSIRIRWFWNALHIVFAQRVWYEYERREQLAPPPGPGRGGQKPNLFFQSLAFSMKRGGSGEGGEKKPLKNHKNSVHSLHYSLLKTYKKHKKNKSFSSSYIPTLKENNI